MYARLRCGVIYLCTVSDPVSECNLAYGQAAFAKFPILDEVLPPSQYTTDYNERN